MTENSTSRFDQWLDWAKNHKIVVAVLLMLLMVNGISTFFSSLDTIYNFSISMRIYLDVCCLNGPFDDHTRDRVRLESEAVLTILSRSQTESWIVLGSEVVDIEIAKTPDAERREKVSFLSSMAQSYIVVDEDIERRVMALEKLGFKSFDALHIACAEKGGTNVLLTTDDDLLRKASQN